MRAIDVFPFFYVLGGLISIYDKYSRRLGDLLAGTIVVNEIEYRIEEPKFETMITSPAIKTGRKPIGVSRHLTEEELWVIRRFLNERGKLAEKKHEEISIKLASSIKKKLGIGRRITDPVAFIEEVYREHSVED